jgi:hypothetical protein
MTGSTTAIVVIPIVAFLLLIIWLSMVYYADLHPQWRGHQPMPQQRMTFLPNTAEVMGANPPASDTIEVASVPVATSPGSAAVAGTPGSAEPEEAGRPVSAEPEGTEPRPTVPGQRVASGAAGGATAVRQAPGRPGR